MSIDDFEDSNPNFCPLIKGPLIQNRGLFITGAMVITGGLGITGASGCNRGITGASSPAGGPLLCACRGSVSGRGPKISLRLNTAADTSQGFTINDVQWSAVSVTSSGTD